MKIQLKEGLIELETETSEETHFILTSLAINVELPKLGEIEEDKVKRNYKKRRKYQRGKHCIICGKTLPSNKHKLCGNLECKKERIRKNHKYAYKMRTRKPNGKNCEICQKELIGKQKRACGKNCRNELLKKIKQEYLRSKIN